MARALPIIVQLEVLRAQRMNALTAFAPFRYPLPDEDELFVEECRRAAELP